MPSTYSPNLRIELIANGEQSGTWGSTTNNNLGSLLENAVSGYVDVVVTSADQALVALNGVNDEARNMIINFSSTSTVGGAFTIYVPPAEKLYVFRNNTSHTATVRASTTLNGTTPTNNGGSPPVYGLSVVIPPGKTVMVYCDGKSPLYDVVDALTHVDGNFSASGAITASTLAASNLSLANPLTEANGGTGFSAYTTGSLLYANNPTTLYQLYPGTAGYPLLTQGTGAAPTWGQVDLSTAVTGNLPVTNLDGGTSASASTFWRGDGVWAIPAGAGDVVGPGTSTNNAVPRYDGISGTQLKNSSVTISDAGQLSATSFAGSLSSSSFTGALPATNGGTGQTAYATGDTIYASAANTVSKLTIGTTGQALTVSGGVPTWGTLPVAGGGTGATTLTLNNVLLGNGTSAVQTVAPGTSGNVLTSNGTTWLSGSPFVAGMIMMWSGTIANIPSGWALCNGANGTPDLRNRFVIGASVDSGGIAYTTVTGANTKSGGSKDSVVVSHTHSFSGSTTSANAHSHTYSFGLADNNNDNGTLPAAGLLASNLRNSDTFTTDTVAAHTHDYSGTTGSAGVTGTNANLTPYYALAFIMKL